MSIEQLTASDNGEQQINVCDKMLIKLALDLAEDPENDQRLGSLAQEASKWPSFEYQYSILKTTGLAGSPFMVLAVLGQDFLNRNMVVEAMQILESALKISPENKNKKLRASICASLASAHFSMRQYREALKYMIEDARLEGEVGDVEGQCRALRNMAHLQFKIGRFEDSIASHRRLIDLAMRERLFKHVCYTLSALGHVHSESQNLNAALTSHDRSLVLMRELAESQYDQFKELMAIGHIHSLLDDFKASQERYEEAAELLAAGELHQNMTKDQLFEGKIMLLFNRALIALKTSSYGEGRKYYEEILKLANGMNDRKKRDKLEMRACLGLAHTSRLEKNLDESRKWSERQLELAHDLTATSQALTNLAMSYQHARDFERAHELFTENHKLVAGAPSQQQATRGQSHLLALSHSYLGCVRQLMGVQAGGGWAALAEAREHYEKSLEILQSLEACEEQRKSVEQNLEILTNVIADFEATKMEPKASELSPTQASDMAQPSAAATAPSAESKTTSARTSTSVSNNTSASNSKSNSTNDIANHHHQTSTNNMNINSS